MPFERSRPLRAPACALAVCAAAAQLPHPAAAALLPATTTSTHRIVRSAGTCPAGVTLLTRARPYEGGAAFETVLRTSAFAMPPRVVTATQDRVVFFAPRLAPAYATCEGSARFTDSGSRYTVTLHGGTMRFVFISSPELQEIRARVASGDPVITSAVAD